MTVELSSSIRLALVAPGDPYPRVILSSSDEMSDLIGFYSLRELGMNELFAYRPKNTVINALFKPSKHTGDSEGFSSFDFWDYRGKTDDAREKMYSLIVEGDTLSFSDFETKEYSGGIDKLLRDAVDAYVEDDVAKLEYSGQVLTTILELIAAKRAERFRRRRVLMGFILSFSVFYIAALLIVITGQFTIR